MFKNQCCEAGAVRSRNLRLELEPGVYVLAEKILGEGYQLMSLKRENVKRGREKG
jgi:hypothetical protein